MQYNGYFTITNRKIEISINKAYFNRIENFKTKYEKDIKFFNTYDNDKTIFIQIYLNNELTLEKYIDLKEIGLHQKALYVEFKNPRNENEL